MLRDEVAQIQSLIKVLAGKSVLITGGTGSFGKAFTTAALKYSEAARIIVFSRDEQKHYRMQQEYSDPRLRFFVGDIRDKERLHTAFRGVDILLHAAAMKHVPICEYNPNEAVQTNIMGAKNVIEAALDAKIPKVLGISTDKAVSPVNLYGATKLCMEKLLVAANAYVGERPTRFSVVRYGNVMGSEGSVIPLFSKQAAQGKITITDEKMTRFWISMNGAIALVLRALTNMHGGEVFIPKLPTTDILTLADVLAPGVPREVIGIRPGEKIHEYLVAIEETARTRDIGDVYMIRPDFPFGGFQSWDAGSAVPPDFRYSSDRPELRLSVDATRELLTKI